MFLKQFVKLSQNFVIEKPGIPYLLVKWADKWGIALVNTNGHLTEYGKDLIDAEDASSGHIAIMVDYDIEGIKIASECPSEIKWIGANVKMLRNLKLERGSVAVQSLSGRNKDYVKYWSNIENILRVKIILDRGSRMIDLEKQIWIS
jgi:hypothetical protein